jgi:hypothetical protein
MPITSLQCAREKEIPVSKIFVRHRRHVGQGAGRPRFAIVAVQGSDLKIFKTRIRRAELEKMASEIDAEIVYLPRGENGNGPDNAGGDGKGRRRHRRDQEG